MAILKKVNPLPWANWFCVFLSYHLNEYPINTDKNHEEHKEHEDGFFGIMFILHALHVLHGKIN